MNPAIGIPVAAPHTTTTNSAGRVMATVMAALLPATLFGFWLYGWPAIFLWLITVGSVNIEDRNCWGNLAAEEALKATYKCIAIS